MKISQYHQKYADYPEDEIQKRADVKEDELNEIFKKIPLKTSDEIVRLAVMGSGDKRFCKHHKRIFEKFINKPIEVTTFDIVTDHLNGETNIIQHDCVIPLPKTPYNITYAHVLLKFIETEKQWDLIVNSYNALKEGGIAIHIFDKPDYETTDIKQADGYYAVPLERWKRKLEESDIQYITFPVKYGLALILIK